LKSDKVFFKLLDNEKYKNAQNYLKSKISPNNNLKLLKKYIYLWKIIKKIHWNNNIKNRWCWKK